MFADVPISRRRPRLSISPETVLQKRFQRGGAAAALHQVQRGCAILQHGRVPSGTQG